MSYSLVRRPIGIANITLIFAVRADRVSFHWYSPKSRKLLSLFFSVVDTSLPLLSSEAKQLRLFHATTSSYHACPEHGRQLPTPPRSAVDAYLDILQFFLRRLC
jgi:hypothetical protein